MSLGDFFPDELREGFGTRNLKVGSVIKLKVKDTNPPKEKRFIVVGITEDKLCLATVFINTEINTIINWSPELRALNIELKKEGREFLDWDSYVDCSKLSFRDYNELKEILDSKPEAVIGELSDADSFLIKETIKSASTIKGKHKKKFGFYEG